MERRTKGTLSRKWKNKGRETEIQETIVHRGDFLAATARLIVLLLWSDYAKAESGVAPEHIIFSLSRTSINIYTNNEVLIGEGESHRQTSRPTAKSMA